MLSSSAQHGDGVQGQREHKPHAVPVAWRSTHRKSSGDWVPGSCLGPWEELWFVSWLEKGKAEVFRTFSWVSANGLALTAAEEKPALKKDVQEYHIKTCWAAVKKITKDLLSDIRGKGSFKDLASACRTTLAGQYRCEQCWPHSRAGTYHKWTIWQVLF